MLFSQIEMDMEYNPCHSHIPMYARARERAHAHTQCFNKHFANPFVQVVVCLCADDNIDLHLHDL